MKSIDKEYASKAAELYNPTLWPLDALIGKYIGGLALFLVVALTRHLISFSHLLVFLRFECSTNHFGEWNAR